MYNGIIKTNLLNIFPVTVDDINIEDSIYGVPVPLLVSCMTGIATITHCVEIVPLPI